MMQSVDPALKEASDRLRGFIVGPGTGIKLMTQGGLTVIVQREDSLEAALERYGKAFGLSTAALARQTPAGVSSDTGVHHRVRPKKIADVVCKVLSTWQFRQTAIERLTGLKVNLVGQHYRSARDNEVLGWKKSGNMALLVAEPDNPADLNAVMVLMWDDRDKEWRHVGYVRREQAMLLRGKWSGDHHNVMVARITSKPVDADGHREGRNIELTLTGEMRTYPGYKGV